jgi:hypothetical protein
LRTAIAPWEGACAPRVWRRGTCHFRRSETILQQNLSALINEGIKLVTVEQDPARCAANAEPGLPIALHRQTHNVQGAALQKAVQCIDADAQVGGCRISIEQSRSGTDEN